MNFDLPESHREIQRSVRELCLRQVAPAARGWDHDASLPPSIIGSFAELGVWGIAIPESYGGAGLDALALALVVEEVARADGSLALAVATHNGPAVQLLALAANRDLAARLLPAAATGTTLAAFIDADRGLRAAFAPARWSLSGAPARVTLGGLAGILVALARDDRGGLRCFVAAPAPPGLRGLRRVATLGLRACDTSDLDLEDLEALPLEIDLAVLQGIRDRQHLSLAALALGLGEGALEAAVSYAKDRRQFGRPIADFQAIQWMLADARAELDAARVLVLRAALTLDAGRAASAEAATARLYAGEAATRACSRALQVHGGYGYTREFPVERHLRDARAVALHGGAAEASRAAISRDLLASP